MSGSFRGPSEIASEVCELGCGGISIVSSSDLLLEALVELHGIDRQNYYWWESLNSSAVLNYGASVEDWRVLADSLLADMGDPVFLVVTDDEPYPWPVLRVEKGSDLPRLLAEMPFFEYFVFSHDCARVFFDTHDNILVSSP